MRDQAEDNAAAADAGLKPVLAGLRVLDLAHQYAGAHCACLLADLGASVIAIENPKGSPIRTMLPRREDQSLWWKVHQRGKKNITLKLSSPEGRRLFLELARNADVVIENFRPGTMEKWGIGPADMEAAGARLTMLRISGYGQTGPMRDRPGFGTIAEAMSGFAHLNGFPDGPPVFPSATLADSSAGLFGAFGIMASQFARGRQDLPAIHVVDMALFEALFRLIPTQVPCVDQLGKVPIRPGNYKGSYGVMRNLWQTKDGKFLTASGVGPVAIRRIVAATGDNSLTSRIDNGIMHESAEVVEAFMGECDQAMADFCARTLFEDVTQKLDEVGAVYGTVYDAQDILNDPQYRARGDIIEVADEDFGKIRMQGVVPKFASHQHDIAHAGRAPGAANAEVFGELLGLTDEQIRNLKDAAII